ncbi:unnamed protein product [Psylliodes chrysocephalus]|uniref:SCP domain-containing protein n=1 Tax=Psylliodes chrysocephalus TaxID=3402493 RepID=A0A9P0D6M0_9CUCU|nr:unnamed protein product [Psylliodes chrysocephala]
MKSFCIIAVLFFTCLTFITCNEYCRFACDVGSHTMCIRENEKCGPGPKCGNFYKPIEFTFADRQYIVDLHNYLRNKVATGKEVIGSQYSATNMKALTYNMELEQIAKCWTNNCIYGHDSCRSTNSYDWVGQNIGITWYKGVLGNYRTVINNTILAWYDEVTNFEANWVHNYGHYENVVAHYTQVVWADTREIGCGMTFWVEGTFFNYFFACNYGPGGNYLSEPVYQPGPPASACFGLKANQVYRGLCGPEYL